MAVTRFDKVMFLSFVAMSVFHTTKSLPVLDLSEISGSSESNESNKSNERIETVSNSNKTRNLYVVKAVVYEIGILTDSSDEDNSTEFESQERVDLTFFNGRRNDSHIDLGKVPLPIQTNISGQVLTGIAPVDIGAFSSPEQLLQTLPITGTIVNITHSDTGYFVLKTSNLTEAERPHVLSVNDLRQIPDITQSFPDINQLIDESTNTINPSERYKAASENLIKK